MATSSDNTPKHKSCEDLITFIVLNIIKQNRIENAFTLYILNITPCILFLVLKENTFAASKSCNIQV